MVKNITLSADELLIEQARAKAQAENSSLNTLFRRWLDQYVGREQAAGDFRDLMKRMSHIEARRKFTRDEMNER